MQGALPGDAAGSPTEPLFVGRTSALTQPGIARILRALGHTLHTSDAPPGGTAALWGPAPVPVGHHAPVLRVSDALLRSVRRAGDGGRAPFGLLLDPVGAHWDGAHPSMLEDLLAGHPLDDSALMARARDGMARLSSGHIGKYSDADPAAPLPPPGYVLVVDELRGRPGHGPDTAAILREMLVFAQEEHPGARILIRAHPDAVAHRALGHYGEGHATGLVSYHDAAVSPWALMEGAIAVYTHSSQMGFEAIVAGHRPRVFGQPFYAGWGLSDDEHPVPRRHRRLTRAQLFAAAMILAPHWFDPCRERLCSFEEVLDQFEAETRAWREDRAGYVALGVRAWKRPVLRRFFADGPAPAYARDPASAVTRARAAGRALLVWAGAEDSDLAADAGEVPLRRLEDGFLRSRGLGAELVPPLSLVADDLGIYYDPSRESRLERLIAGPIPPGAEMRAEKLIARIARGRLSKYNIGSRDLPDLPGGRRILVPGQVGDDASLLCGAQEVRSNLALLQRTRAENPDAIILYKPHPDVEAGLRPGRIDEVEALSLANHVLSGTDPAVLIEAVDDVWTMTSLLGFEALIRGRAVTCLGAPFYAGWGLTRDLGPVPARRQARPGLARLVHAALIAYPRYHDPVSGLPCPVEVVADRLALGQVPPRGAGLTALSFLQRRYARLRTGRD